MTTTESTFLDRSRWRAGPWDAEPDRIYWEDDTTGLPCLIRRGPVGALCGYVAVGPDHPWHGRSYSDCTLAEPCGQSYCGHGPEYVVEVHGGLTYAAECDGDKAQGICHVPEPDQPDDAWWFGFDCAHAGDVVPAISDFGFDGDDVYKRVAYVRAEVERLARQLAEVER